jgi:hypothetical protein
MTDPDELRKRMHFLAPLVDRFLNGEDAGSSKARIGFVLMVSAFSKQPEFCNYISNGRREDVIMLLKEQLARFEGQPEVSGRA